MKKNVSKYEIFSLFSHFKKNGVTVFMYSFTQCYNCYTLTPFSDYAVMVVFNYTSTKFSSINQIFYVFHIG